MHYGAVVEHPEGFTEVTVGPLAQVPLDNRHLQGRDGVRYTYNDGPCYGKAVLRPARGGAEVLLSLRDQAGLPLFETRVAV
jgi:hypothetical protein